MVKRRSLLLGLAASPLMPLGLASVGPARGQAVVPPGLEGDRFPTGQGDLLVHIVGHASMILAWGGHVVHVDPVGGAARYGELPAPTGILVTHGHPDHFDAATLTALAGDAVPLLVPRAVAEELPAELAGRASVLANGERGTLSGISIEAVAAYNTTPERAQYHPPGAGNGYVLNLGELRVYIAGDTEVTPEMAALADIGLAFVPMNLPFTMSEAEAAEAVRSFAPGIVYPYHYQGSDPQVFADLLADEPGIEVRLRDWYGEAG